jgi:5-hydroxyisourate hydrolase-like protein (transthyretin family)
MPGNPSAPRFVPWIPLGTATVVGTALAAFLLVGNRSTEAGAVPFKPEAKAGFQTMDKLVLTVNLPGTAGRNLRGVLRVELLGSDDKPLAAEERKVETGPEASTHRFEFASRKGATPVSVRCRFGKEEYKVALDKILLVKAHEMALTAGQEFHAGSNTSLRCDVHGVKSLTETVPLPGAFITVRLRSADGKKEFTLYEGKTGADGKADVQFKVPVVPSGSYKMEVATKSNLGEEKLERDVKVKAEPKILLVSDKPLYQPGQVMHLRALALNAFDLKPVEKAKLVFEVEDAKGNKVFKNEQETSAFGVASVDFQLADEVNQGEYHVRAILGQQQTDKTVTVKPYVLPKFKAELTADKKYYLPKETIHGALQSDYFFGKPVAGAKIKVTASTFDVAFRDFQTWEGKTDSAGHAKFEIKLPDYFVGQPLDKGNALVRLEVKLTDTADHSETISKTFPVSNQAIRVSLIPEAGRLVPGLENRVFAAAIYPDGSPAQCEVNLWTGPAAKDKPFASVKTNEAGLAEFRLTPKPEQFRPAEWETRNVELLGGQTHVVGGQKSVLDLTAEAKDAKGNTAKTTAALSSEPFGENVLLRLDKAVYKGGDPIQVDVFSSAGLPTTYLDVVRGGQTLLTKWLDVKDGKAAYRLNLPAEAFGTLELHAYQMIPGGEIIRDSRVIYVQQADGLQINVKPDQTVYAPGSEGKIRFEVTDAAGKPTAAALGILVVDEAVYALQEMQPGLEKVYFTLQEELLKPQAQAVYKPNETINDLVREPILADARQQIAQVLLASVKPKPPARWEVAPALERRRKMEEKIVQIGWALHNYAVQNKPVLVQDRKTKDWTFKPGLLKELLDAHYLQPDALTDPVGGKLTLDALAGIEKDFTANRFARHLTLQRIQQLGWTLVNYSNQRQAKWFKDGKWTFPESVLTDAAKSQGLGGEWLKDAWGHPLQLVKHDKKRDHKVGVSQFDYHEIVSVGPDGKLGTADDVHLTQPNNPYGWGLAWWTGDDTRQGLLAQRMLPTRRRILEQFQFERAAARDGNVMMARGGGGVAFGGGVAKGVAAPAMVPAGAAGRPLLKEDRKLGASDKVGGDAGAAAPTRLREYFPETMLWQPALITDDRGIALLPVNFADSITTWRLTASASSRGGLLGGVTTPLRVFQDFFVDLDLPLNLTQYDEVAFPVAVYNYLKTPQTVKLDLQPEDWFELTDGLGLSRALDVKPGEVTAVKFRIRAKRIGHFPLTVKATGSKTSDAIKRSIEVVPFGKKIEQVVSDRLTGRVTQSIVIPETAIPDASKLFVKVYPGVFSQILEGTEGMLRLPGG